MKPECLSEYLRYRHTLEMIPQIDIEDLSDEVVQAFTELSAMFDRVEVSISERLPKPLAEYFKKVYDSKYIDEKTFDYHDISPLAKGYLCMIYPAYLCDTEEEIEKEMEIRIRYDKEQLMKKCKEIMDKEKIEEDEE